MALVILQINEFHCIIDKLYIVILFFVIHPTQHTSKHVANMHPETFPNLTKLMFEYMWIYCISGIDFDFKNDFTSDPKMTTTVNQNDFLGPSGGHLGQPWGPPDASRPILAPIRHPK